MGKKRQMRAISGWVNFDKPYGMTSTQAVGKIRYLFQAKKAGHAGTLDPLAEGILPIALGEATKTIPYVMDAVKCYEFTVRWGLATSTDDAEGDVICQSDVYPKHSEIEAVLKHFRGIIEQTPPIYSAIKVSGKRAYHLARSGEAVILKKRSVAIHRLCLTYMSDNHHANFSVTCGKGTYIRALARDLALKLGTFGYVKYLRRVRTGPFSEKTVTTLDELKGLSLSDVAMGVFDSFLLPLTTVLNDMPVLVVDEGEARNIKLGQAVVVSGNDRLLGDMVSEHHVLIMQMDTPVALGILKKFEDNNIFQPTRVFNM